MWTTGSGCGVDEFGTLDFLAADNLNVKCDNLNVKC